MVYELEDRLYRRSKTRSARYIRVYRERFIWAGYCFTFFHFPLYADEPWRGQGLRSFPVGNYLVFYLPVEKVERVEIVRIMYGRRDIEGQLKETITIE